MSISVKVGTEYKLVYNVYQKIAGEWVECKKVFIKSAGKWKLTHEALEPFIFTANLSGTLYNYNVRDKALIAGWNGINPLHATINLASCTIGAASQNSYAFSSGFNLPEGSFIRLNGDATSKIIGRGGRGGTGSTSGSTFIAENGSPALFTTVRLILNFLGTIAGGGGGGAGGDSAYAFNGAYGAFVGGGGGAGGGAGLGLGGIGGASSTTAAPPTMGQELVVVNGEDGYTAGQLAITPNPFTAARVSGGGGQSYFITDPLNGDPDVKATGGYGAYGGALGSDGEDGSLVVGAFRASVTGSVGGTTSVITPYGTAGLAGKSISGYSFVEVIASGTILGAFE